MEVTVAMTTRIFTVSADREAVQDRVTLTYIDTLDCNKLKTIEHLCEILLLADDPAEILVFRRG